MAAPVQKIVTVHVLAASPDLWDELNAVAAKSLNMTTSIAASTHPAQPTDFSGPTVLLDGGGAETLGSVI